MDAPPKPSAGLVSRLQAEIRSLKRQLADAETEIARLRVGRTATGETALVADAIAAARALMDTPPHGCPHFRVRRDLAETLLAALDRLDPDNAE